MLRRLLTCAFVALFVAAPVATDLCNAACAAAEAGHVAGAPVAHHSCHSEASTAPRTISGVPHSCGHSEGAPDGVDVALHRLAAPAIVDLAVEMQAATDVAAPVGNVPLYRSPPLARLSQLRV
jgi:hypothetical protein